MFYKIYYCTCNPTFFYVMHMIYWWKQCVHSWHPSAMNGSIAKVNKVFFSENLSLSYIREICYQYTDKSRVFKAILVLCLYATHSTIFVNNVKMAQWGQPYPTSERHSVLCTYCGYTLIEVSTGETLSFLVILSRRCSVLDKTLCLRYVSGIRCYISMYRRGTFQVSVKDPRTIYTKNVRERQYVRIWAKMLAISTVTSRSLGQDF